MRRFFVWAVLFIAFSGAPLLLSAGQQLTVRFVGNIHGAKASAVVAFEQMRGYRLMSGEIQSNGHRYTFTADIYDEAGFGQMTDYSQGTRFQIKIQIYSNGLALTSNPLGPGTPTTYTFRNVE